MNREDLALDLDFAQDTERSSVREQMNDIRNLCIYE